MVYTRPVHSDPFADGSATDLTVVLDALSDGLENTEPVFNVMHYGAVGNGVADDTAAIQSAVTAAAVAGGIAYVPEGTYKTTSTITIPSHVTLRGAGLGRSHFVASGGATATHMLLLSGELDVVVEDLDVDAGMTFYTTVRIYSSASPTVYATEHRIRRCRLSGGNFVTVSSAAILHDFRIDECLLDGPLSIDSGSAGHDGIVIAGNRGPRFQVWANGTPAAGGWGSNVQIVDNVLTGGDSSVIPIECIYYSNVIISGNVIEEAGLNGISTGGNLNVLISDNVIADQSAYAIEASGHHITVTGNKVRDCASMVAGTASDRTETSHVVISGNTHVGTGLSAPGSAYSIIFQTIEESLTIEDNYFSGLEYSGAIYTSWQAGDVTDVVVRGNTHVVDTTNASVVSLAVRACSRGVFENNTTIVRRNLVAGDEYLASYRWLQGGPVTDAIIRNNQVIYSGTVAAAPHQYAFGNNNAPGDTFPRCMFVGNTVKNGAMAWMFGSTSADFIWADNVATDCLTSSTAPAATVIGRFITGAPLRPPTITGSRGSNAALASLLTQLATLGIVVDSTS